MPEPMPDPLVLVLNAGSSSLKFGLYASASPPRALVVGSIDRLDKGAFERAGLLDRLSGPLEPHGGLARIAAVGHRFVHGGRDFVDSCALTPDALAALGRLAALDPDHMPAEIAVVEAVRARAPAVLQVGCFDTAFHRTMPRVARRLPIPRAYADRGIERYGFHGLSYTYVAEELARIAGARVARGRVVVAHLGSGASLVALRDAQSVDTTMGFTPTSGIPMATRSGDLDPGVLLHLLRSEGMSVDDLDAMLNRGSGLLGVSATSGDVRDLLAHEAKDPRAAEALEVFSYRVRQAIGSLAATLGGVETLVFTGGIGENSAPIRARVLTGLEHLGVSASRTRNEAGDAVISNDGSPCTVRVIRTDEQSVIARETFRIVENTRGAA